MMSISAPVGSANVDHSEAQGAEPRDTNTAPRASIDSIVAPGSAPANPTAKMRSVLTVIYYADGARVDAADHPARQLDLALWLGNAEPGSPADVNPLLWHESWDPPAR